MCFAIELFSVELNNVIYKPGEEIRGYVIIKLKKETNIDYLTIKLHGFSKVHWTESESYTDSDGSSQSRSISYDNYEEYVKIKFRILEKTKLSMDINKFPFGFTLPSECPPSFEGDGRGCTSYFVKSSINIPWSFNKKVSKEIKVICSSDLNLLPGLRSPLEMTHLQKFFRFPFGSKKSVNVKVVITKGGFVPGERIPFYVAICNMSDKKLSMKAKMLQNIRLIAKTNTLTYVKEVSYLSAPNEIKKRASMDWNSSLPVPSVPISNTKTNNIIIITYSFLLILKPSGLSKRFSIEMPIVIGTIPIEINNLDTKLYFD